MSARSFTFGSQNTQGFSPLAHHTHVSGISSGRTDFVAVQESGKMPMSNRKKVGSNLYTGSIVGSGVARARRTLTRTVYVTHLEAAGAKGKNKRCSLALYSAIKPLRVGSVKSREKSKGVRPMLEADLGDVMIYNLHLPSGRPKFAQRVLRGFLSDIERRRMVKPRGGKGLKRRPQPAPIGVFGDMNMSRRQLLEVAKPFGYGVASPSTASHEGGSTLDHVLFRDMSVGTPATSHGTSDHSALHGTLKF